MLTGDKPVSERVLAAEGATERDAAFQRATASSTDHIRLAVTDGPVLRREARPALHDRAGMNAEAVRASHRHNAIVCGDTGAGQVKPK